MHLVVVVPAEAWWRSSPGLLQREVVALADVVEIAGLHHQMMDAGLAGLDEGDAVVARIDVEEIGRERLE